LDFIGVFWSGRAAIYSDNECEIRLIEEAIALASGAKRYGPVARERAGPNKVLIFRQHNAGGDPSRVGKGLSAKHRCDCAGRARHDSEQVAHPIEDHDRDTMRSAEP
jgi:hypothetical protein